MKEDHSILKRKSLFNDFEIQFFIEVNDGAEIYRIKDKDENLGLLKLYPFMKLSALRFSYSLELNEVAILKEISHKNVIHLRTSGETIINGEKFI